MMSTWWTVILLTILLMTLAVLFLAIKILLKKNGKFPNTHVSSNKALKKQGITCAHSFDRMEQEKVRKKVDFKNVSFIKPSSN
ncbi:MAG: hypothetical protein CR987_00470 [Draconibacterium sp.]|nr:MAG: hypothetical protein CR987_00470 [Draconibacterium sp.]